MCISYPRFNFIYIYMMKNSFGFTVNFYFSCIHTKTAREQNEILEKNRRVKRIYHDY